eukprot:6487801-Amphidinium_carterae.2
MRISSPFPRALANHRGEVPSSETPAEIVVPVGQYLQTYPETLRKGLSKHYKALEDKKGTSASSDSGWILA